MNEHLSDERKRRAFSRLRYVVSASSARDGVPYENILGAYADILITFSVRRRPRVRPRRSLLDADGLIGRENTRRTVLTHKAFSDNSTITTMDTPRRVQGARRLSSPPTMHTFRPPLTPRSRSTILRRRRPVQPLSRAALKSLAPLNLDIPASVPTAPAPAESSLYFVVLSHLTDLEARLHASAPSGALEILQKLRDEVAAFFPSLHDGPSSEPSSSSKQAVDELEYDFEYDFGLRAALDFASQLDLDLDLNLRARYAELSTLSLDEAKNKLAALNDDAKSTLDALTLRIGDAKNRLVNWASLGIPDLPTLPLPDLPALPDLPTLPLPDLHARLAELCAALPADLSSATDRLVSFVENLIEDDADGDVSWVDTRWKGLNAGKGKGVAGVAVDMHAVALRLSEGGKRLIRYCELPEKWRNNEFVEGGYRFIPGAKWPALIWSAFEMHNETVNIHTHLIPLLAILSVLPLSWTQLAHSWDLNTLIPTIPLPSLPLLPNIPALPSIPTLPSSIPTISSLGISFEPLPASPADALPKFLFLLAAAACLACSTAWHTLAGCSDLWWLEAGARVDYVGIGWLISASVSGVMYYG
ncbi:hypothetical protein FRC09_013476 [Ceratobasidium sp. 395]|nr:hypothetical protein FRC09_013476 [Ceratobasidium sp. 395]